MTVSKSRIYSRIQLAAHHMKKHADRQLTSVANLTTAQGAVLTVIAQNEKVTQKNVATALGLNESGVTAMVRRLINLGYVKRLRSVEDTRAWNLFLTDAGLEMRNRMAVPYENINARIGTCLDDFEIEILVEYMDRLIDGFED